MLASHLLAGFHLARGILVKLAYVDKYAALELGDNDAALVGQLDEECQQVVVTKWLGPGRGGGVASMD